ncbi:MAG: branched-chain amino acid ABC transporter substrate-binding protein [Candidatus Eremiobacteraeota bacterium]|nr:branched-chain amino acid ABC transporter substrate-binding protein [Candidatus Eremiobacteraeota bacterium]
MKTGKRTRRAFAGGIGAALAATAAKGSAQINPQASVAVVCPLSGPESQAGTQLANGVRGALDDANGTRGLFDRFWSLRTFDDQGTMAQALLEAQFAINDLNQSAAIGHLGGKITNQLVRQYANAAMPLIVPATTLDSITQQGYRNVFRLPTKDTTEGILHARYVKKENRGKKIAVVSADGADYGPAVAFAFYKQTGGDGLTPFDARFPADRPDFDALARRIVAQGADLVFLSGLARDLGPLIPALRGAGYGGQFDGPSGFFDGALVPSYGSAVEGLTVSTSMPPLQIVPQAMAIKQNYEQHYGPMGPLAAFGYAATQMFVAAIRRGSTIARLGVMRTLAQPIAFDTIVGSFTFDAYGDANDPNVYFYQLQGGNWHYVRAAHPSGFIVR